MPNAIDLVTLDKKLKRVVNDVADLEKKVTDLTRRLSILDSKLR